MKKVARLVEFSLRTRVVVDENATEDEIIRASYKGIQDKITNEELGDNLVECELDDECPIGTFDTDLPTIDRIILNPNTRQYLVVGKGLPTQVISFDEDGEWNSVNEFEGGAIFDVQMDDNNEGEGKPDWSFQYVSLIWNEDEQNFNMGQDFKGIDVELTELPITQEVVKLFENKVL
jgi:hypothetical protein